MGNECSRTQNTVSKTFSRSRFLASLVHGPFSFVMDVGACPVTMVIPSLGQEITAALVLAQMVPAVDASLPVAAIKILLLYSLRASVILGTLVSNVETVEEKGSL